MKKQIDPNQLLTSKQVATLLGVHARTVLRLIKSGKFPNARKAVDYHTAPYLIPGSDVIAYLEDK